jgi:hypothetical protein
VKYLGADGCGVGLCGECCRHHAVISLGAVSPGVGRVPARL